MLSLTVHSTIQVASNILVVGKLFVPVVADRQPVVGLGPLSLAEDKSEHPVERRLSPVGRKWVEHMQLAAHKEVADR